MRWAIVVGRSVSVLIISSAPRTSPVTVQNCMCTWEIGGSENLRSRDGFVDWNWRDEFSLSSKKSSCGVEYLAMRASMMRGERLEKDVESLDGDGEWEWGLCLLMDGWLDGWELVEDSCEGKDT